MNLAEIFRPRPFTQTPQNDKEAIKLLKYMIKISKVTTKEVYEIFIQCFNQENESLMIGMINLLLMIDESAHYTTQKEKKSVEKLIYYLEPRYIASMIDQFDEHKFDFEKIRTRYNQYLMRKLRDAQ